jgi:hypothetical protein
VPVKTTSLIYAAAGAPPLKRAAAGACRTCGLDGIGMDFSAWVRPTFTDWDKLTGGSIICEACQFCFEDANPVLDAKLGKPKQRMRNYSHFVHAGEWIPISKGNKRRMRELLLDPETEVAVIAESGQKHIIFRARPGWWQFEEAPLRPFARKLTEVLGAVEALYNGGFSKAEIETGRYIQHRILTFGLDQWRPLEHLVSSVRGTHALELALFLAQKEEADGESDDSGQVTVPDMARDRRRLQEQVRAQHLGPVRRPDKKRGVYGEPPTLF